MKEKIVPKTEPSLKDFILPKSQTEWDQMIKKMNGCGFDLTAAFGIIKARKLMESSLK